MLELFGPCVSVWLLGSYLYLSTVDRSFNLSVLREIDRSRATSDSMEEEEDPCQPLLGGDAISSDDTRLNQLGYKQELSRHLSYEPYPLEFLFTLNFFCTGIRFCCISEGTFEFWLFCIGASGFMQLSTFHCMSILFPTSQSHILKFCLLLDDYHLFIKQLFWTFSRWISVLARARIIRLLISTKISKMHQIFWYISCHSQLLFKTLT